MSIKETVLGQGGFLKELRYGNTFNEEKFDEVKEYLNSNVTQWKEKGVVPAEDVLVIVEMMVRLFGDSSYLTEDVRLLAEGAAFEVEDILQQLEE